MNEKEKWLDWAIEIQSIAQAGLTYGKEEIPENLAFEKVNKDQILMCFDAYESKHWDTKFD